MKKYLEPTIDLTEIKVASILLASGNLEEGESLWDNETPLIPFN